MNPFKANHQKHLSRAFLQWLYSTNHHGRHSGKARIPVVAVGAATHPKVKRYKRKAGAVFTAMALYFSVHSFAQSAGWNAPHEYRQKAPLSEGFEHPPFTARPWVFWMWLRVDSTPEAITKDLEEMHAKGIEGAIIYDSGVGGGLEASFRMVLKDNEYVKMPTADYAGAHITAIPFPPIASWQPRSLELLRIAAKEAARLKIRLVLSIGLASTSGPIDAIYGQQQLVWSEAAVDGPGVVDQSLPDPRTTIPYRSIWHSQKMSEAHSVAESTFSSIPVAVLAVPDRENYGPADVIDISTKVDDEGRLRWQAPSGKWKIMRFAYMPTGAKNVWGYYTDGMSAEALDKTWDVTIGKLLASMSPMERSGLYGIEDDSWEAGEISWTRLFAREFRQMRGYDLIPWLPALAGRQMQGQAGTDAVLRDYRRTVADLIARNHYAHLGELSHKNHLVSFSRQPDPTQSSLIPCRTAKASMYQQENSGFLRHIGPLLRCDFCFVIQQAQVTSTESRSPVARA